MDMNDTTTTTTPSAVRTMKGNRATITVTLPNGEVHTMGGARAARAAVVTAIGYQGCPDTTFSALGDAGAGAAAVARAATDHTMRHAGHQFNVRAARFAYCITVTGSL